MIANLLITMWLDFNKNRKSLYKSLVINSIKPPGIVNEKRIKIITLEKS